MRSEAGKDKALYKQEGRLAAGLNEDQRRDAAQAVKLLPSGWTLTQCVQFVADHVKRTIQVLTVKEAIDHFLVTKEKTSHFHSNDLIRMLSRYINAYSANAKPTPVEIFRSDPPHPQ